MLLLGMLFVFQVFSGCCKCETPIAQFSKILIFSVKLSEASFFRLSLLI